MRTNCLLLTKVVTDVHLEEERLISVSTVLTLDVDSDSGPDVQLGFQDLELAVGDVERLGLDSLGSQLFV